MLYVGRSNSMNLISFAYHEPPLKGHAGTTWLCSTIQRVGEVGGMGRAQARYETKREITVHEGAMCKRSI